MTSATLYREAADLESLLSELDAQYPGRVRVVEVTNAREGGLLGFFARPRVGVHYELTDAGSPMTPVIKKTQRSPEQPQRPLDHGSNGDPLAELIDAADAADAADAGSAGNAGSSRNAGSAGDTAWITRPAPADATDRPVLQGPNAEFAQLLLDLAARKSAERDDVPSPVRTLQAPAPVITAPAQQPERSVGHRGDLTLRRKLAEIGVPIGWVPDDAPHVYAAVEALVGRLPEAPTLPTAPGQLVVIAGPAAAIAPAAHGIRKQLRLPESSVWAVGGPGEPAICDSWQASVAATAHRLSGERVAVAAVATDALDAELAAELIAALKPDALWVHVDATRKPSDTRAMVQEFGPPTALFVTGAARTASPASVWELDVPVALLDGLPPTRSSWAVLLLDKFADLEP
jgi:hypothetical protein